MSNIFIALLVSLGAGGWVAKKFYKTTGRSSQKAITAGVVTGVLTLLVMMTLLNMIPNK